MPTTAEPYLSEGEKRRQDSPWVFLFEIQVSSVQSLRVVPNTSQVEWPASSGTIWYPYDFEFDVIRTSTEQTVSPVTVRTSHADRQLATIYRNNGGFAGKKMRIYRVHMDQLSQSVAHVPYLFRIVGPEESASGISWTLSDFGRIDQESPVRFYAQNLCPFLYGGPECGFDVSIPGAPQTCDQTYDGPNGCKSKGLYQVANNLKKSHPARCGCFFFKPQVRN